MMRVYWVFVVVYSVLISASLAGIAYMGYLKSVNPAFINQAIAAWCLLSVCTLFWIGNFIRGFIIYRK